MLVPAGQDFALSARLIKRICVLLELFEQKGLAAVEVIFSVSVTYKYTCSCLIFGFHQTSRLISIVSAGKSFRVKTSQNKSTPRENSRRENEQTSQSRRRGGIRDLLIGEDKSQWVCLNLYNRGESKTNGSLMSERAFNLT